MVHWCFSSFSAQGGRDYQEDNFAYSQDAESAFVFVCDGLGGESNGEHASLLAAYKLIDIDSTMIGDAPTWCTPFKDTSFDTKGYTTVVGFVFEKSQIKILSCGDSQLFVIQWDDRGNPYCLKQATVFAAARSAVVRCWGKVAGPELFHSSSISLDKKTLVIVASDGIDTILGNLPREQVLLTKRLYHRNIMRFYEEADRMVYLPDSFMELISSVDFKDLPECLGKAAIAEGGDHADNTTIVCALYEPTSSKV